MIERHVRLVEQRENDTFKRAVNHDVIPAGGYTPGSADHRNDRVMELVFRGSKGKGIAFSLTPAGRILWFPVSKVRVEIVSGMLCKVTLPGWLYRDKFGGFSRLKY